MAARAGYKGLVQYKGVPVFRITSWNANINTDTIDTTSFTTSATAWRTFTPGLSGGDFTVTGHWDMDGSTAQKDMQTNVLTPATGTIRLEADQVAGGAYSADCIMSMSVGAAIDGETSVTFNGTFNGAVTYSTTT